MRLVFVLYAEDRGLLPNHAVYQQHYSLGGLFARLRNDAARWPDTMDQRFGAWAQLLALFRLIHGGGGHGDLFFVARKGSLFDPDRFPFLEGRGPDGDPDRETEIPLVPDATVWKVLHSLMVLDGERLSYRTLDVEQIGSVYEAVMGFEVKRTTGRSIAVKSQKRTGAAVIVDLDGLLEVPSGKRVNALNKQTDRKLTPKSAAAVALRDASTVEDIVAALDRIVDRAVTPDIVPRRVSVLQPTDERRRTGSHYTPRSLTEPVVSEALRPILERLGPNASPEDILDLKVLDPATGSGAFLVEACRQLSVRLVEAWNMHGGPPEFSAVEDELLYAQRLIAQQCLYGVDKNPMAIDLARLSLWLVTLARNHEFTFIDHALRHGDSLVGLTRKQIEGFHWKAKARDFQFGIEAEKVQRHVERVSENRRLIRELGDTAPEHELRELLDEADRELAEVRRVADLVAAAFFEGKKAKDREARRRGYANILLEEHQYRGVRLRKRPKTPVAAFHWELEFPEVFERKNPGFDAIVGNPPFAGSVAVVQANVRGYTDWLREIHSGSTGKCDLVAHFFRRAFNLLRSDGAIGFIATNTIAQGDTRLSGLRWICHHGGQIFRAQRRLKWPGEAAVVVSVIHIAKGDVSGLRRLDDCEVKRITAFLFHDGGHDDPERLFANSGKGFLGSGVNGMGFTFGDTKSVSTPLSEMRRLIKVNACNGQVIHPYIGGQEVNTSPTQSHHRYVIHFRDWPLRRADLGTRWHEADDEQRRRWRNDGIVPLDYQEPVAADWPELLEIVQTKVKPERLRSARLSKSSHARRASVWWQLYHQAKELYTAIDGLGRVLVISRVGQHAAFTFLPIGMVYADSTIVFSFDTHTALCTLQSRCHEIWARFFSSSLKDDLRYTPTDCFQTFPFPKNWQQHPALEAVGKTYYDFRAALMIANNEGMTKTYNRFHDPNEHDPQIAELRRLHAAMDRAVLDAYGWTDIPTDCEFLLDYEIDEETWGRKKKPYRYRWPNSVRHDVLARLLALNAERAQEERLAKGDARTGAKTRRTR